MYALIANICICLYITHYPLEWACRSHRFLRKKKGIRICLALRGTSNALRYYFFCLFLEFVTSFDIRVYVLLTCTLWGDVFKEHCDDWWLLVLFLICCLLFIVCSNWQIMLCKAYCCWQCFDIRVLVLRWRYWLGALELHRHKWYYGHFWCRLSGIAPFPQVMGV